MEEVRKSLTKQEQAILADFFEQHDLIRLIEKVVLQHQLNLALSTMANDHDWETYLQNKGEIRAAKWPVEFLAHNYKQHEKARREAQAQQPTPKED